MSSTRRRTAAVLGAALFLIAAPLRAAGGRATALSTRTWFTDVTATGEVDPGNKEISGTLLTPATSKKTSGSGGGSGRGHKL